MTASVTRRPLTVRRVLGQIHLWIGLPLGIVLGVIGITGSLLMIEHPLQKLVSPALYAPGQPGTPRALSEIVAAARAAAPPGSREAAIVPSEDGGPAVVRFSPPRPSGVEGDGRAAGGPPGVGGREVFVDPVSLAIVGSRAAFSGPLGWIHQLHANLFIPGRDGRTVVGWLGLLMLALALTGLTLWWPKGQWRSGRWRRAFLVARGTKGWRLNRELHGAAGVWGFVVFLLVSATGVVLAFPGTSLSVVSTVLETRDGRARQQAVRLEPPHDGGVADGAGVDEIAGLARTAVGGGTLRMLALPAQPGQPARVMLSDPAAGHGFSTVLIDPGRRRVVQVSTPASSSPGERLLLWMRLLHEGEGLGSIWAVLVFASGFLPALFTATGTAMWLLRRRARRRRQGPLDRSPDGSLGGPAARGGSLKGTS